MFSRTVLLLLVSCVAACLAGNQMEVITSAKKIPLMSEWGILVTSMALTFGAVAIVLLPAIAYYKYASRKMNDLIF